MFIYKNRIIFHLFGDPRTGDSENIGCVCHMPNLIHYFIYQDGEPIRSWHFTKIRR